MTCPSGLALAEVAADPHAAWRVLHGLGGVVRTDEAWLVGDFATVEAALASDALRTAGATAAPMPIHLTRSAGYRAFARFWSSAMVMHDGERHAALRRAVQAAWPPVRAIESTVRAVVAAVVEALPGDVPFELADRVAAPLPVRVVAALLGVDGAPLEALEPDAAALARFLGGADHEDERRRALDAAGTLWAHFEAADRDAGGLLAALRAEGTLSTTQRIAQAVLLFTAGHQTTRDALCTAAIALAEHPAVQDAMRRGELTAGRVVDEVLRWDGPVQVASRTAAQPVTLGTAAVAAGERVAICLGAANRDPARFAEPEQFRPELPRPRHVAFGTGPHTCLGAALARLELQAAIEALVARGRIERAGPAIRIPNLTFRRLGSVPIRFAPG